MKTIRKLKWMMVAILLGITTSQLWAADYSYSQSSGTTTLTLTSATGGFKVNNSSTVYSSIADITVNGGTLTITFNTTGVVNIKGQIKLTKGTLNLNTGSSTTFNHSHLKRHGSNLGTLIYVENSTTNVNSCKLVINGNATKGNFSIHGNASWSTDYSTHVATLTSGASEAPLIQVRAV